MKISFPQKNFTLCIILFLFCFALNVAACEKNTQHTSGDQSWGTGTIRAKLCRKVEINERFQPDEP
jgi:hypothetical protein